MDVWRCLFYRPVSGVSISVGRFCVLHRSASAFFVYCSADLGCRISHCNHSCTPFSYTHRIHPSCSYLVQLRSVRARLVPPASLRNTAMRLGFINRLLHSLFVQLDLDVSCGRLQTCFPCNFHLTNISINMFRSTGWQKETSTY